MIADSRISDYILSLETGQGQLCDHIRQEALAAQDSPSSTGNRGCPQNPGGR